ncbi:MAG: alpha,alpha-trehalose-phosphate synthase (UDP-forming) [Bacillota bacterium]
MISKSLIMISNAEPYAHKYQENNIIQEKQPGGLTTGLDPLMQELDNSIWIAWARGEADFEVTDKNNSVKVPDDNGYKLKRINLDKTEENGFYYGFSNQTLWPICHNFITKANFSPINWEIYKNVNKKYAKAALAEISGDELIWVQDYQLSLVPEYIKAERPEVKIAHFWHIPWPPAEIFNTIPWRREILDGLLSNDLIGFHTENQAVNFLETARKNGAEINYNNKSGILGTVEYNNHKTQVIALPLGIDFNRLNKKSQTKEIINRAKDLKKYYSASRLLVAVDRLDYTKGIIQRLKAIDRLLEKHSEYKEEITLIQRIAPSRVHINEYKEMENQIDRTIGDINGRYQTADWQPIVYYKGAVPQNELLPYYLAADAALITPLIDGLNLVSKEYIAVRENGQLILSEFAGAANQLEGAILTNPYDIDATAEAIYKAIGSKEKVRKARYEQMRKIVQEEDINWWRNNFLKIWNEIYETKS